MTMYQIAGLLLAAMMGMTTVSAPVVTSAEVYSAMPTHGAVVSTQTVSTSGFSDDHQVSVERTADGHLTIHVANADGSEVQAYTTNGSGTHEFIGANGEVIGSVTIDTGDEQNLVASSAVSFGGKAAGDLAIHDAQGNVIGGVEQYDEAEAVPDWNDLEVDYAEEQLEYGGQLNPEDEMPASGDEQDDDNWGYYGGTHYYDNEAPAYPYEAPMQQPNSNKKWRHNKSHRAANWADRAAEYEAADVQSEQSNLASDYWPKEAAAAEAMPATDDAEQGGVYSFLTGRIAAVQSDGQEQPGAINPFLGRWALKDDPEITYEFMPYGQLLAEYGGQQIQMAYMIDGSKVIMYDGNESIVAGYQLNGDGEMALSDITIYDERGIRPSASTDVLVRIPGDSPAYEDQPIILINNLTGHWQSEDGVAIQFGHGGVILSRDGQEIMYGLYALVGDELMILNKTDGSVHRFAVEISDEDQLYMHERIYDENYGGAALLEPVIFNKYAE